MPLPLILWGIGAGAAAIVGAAGVSVAKDEFDTAERIAKEAEEIFNKAKKQTEKQREKTEKAFNQLGLVKLELYSDEFNKYAQLMENIDLTNVGGSFSEQFDTEEIQSQLKALKVLSAGAKDILSAGASGVAAGGLAAVATYGGVATFGSAATGTAIATLSGLAAQNATLAWLGGGTLAAGAGGIAAGTIVLGGIACAPVLIVGSFVAFCKAQKKVKEAEENREQAKKAKKKFDILRKTLCQVAKVADNYHTCIAKIRPHFASALNQASEIVGQNGDKSFIYSTDADRKVLNKVEDLKEALYSLTEEEWLRDDYSIKPRAQDPIDAANEVMAEYELN